MEVMRMIARGAAGGAVKISVFRSALQGKEQRENKVSVSTFDNPLVVLFRKPDRALPNPSLSLPCGPLPPGEVTESTVAFHSPLILIQLSICWQKNKLLPEGQCGTKRSPQSQPSGKDGQHSARQWLQIPALQKISRAVDKVQCVIRSDHITVNDI